VRPWPRWSAAVRLAILAVAVLISVLPLLIMIDTALKPNGDIAGAQHWIPAHPTAHYLLSTLGGGQMWGWLRSSAIIAAGVTVLSLLLAVPASFALARRRFRGGRLFLSCVLVTQTMAPAVLIVPLFSLFRHLSLLNSYTGVILVSSAFVLPFSIWLLTAFFGQVSVEIEEAAALDRAVGPRFLLRFAVPMCLPGIVATAIWQFTIGVFSSVGEYYVQWQPLMVTALVGVLPMFVLFLALLRWFEVGLSETFASSQAGA
jgi:ABC-type glycerol-3-phosphate transport system permease component